MDMRTRRARYLFDQQGLKGAVFLIDQLAAAEERCGEKVKFVSGLGLPIEDSTALEQLSLLATGVRPLPFDEKKFNSHCFVAGNVMRLSSRTNPRCIPALVP